MSHIVRMSDIAEKIGVSTVTVSKALSGKAGVGSEMREKIQALASDMGYAKHIPLKPSKSLHKTGNIGIIIPARFLLLENDSFYWGLYRAVLGFLDERNYYGILEVLKDDDERDLNLPRMLAERKTDGLILMGQQSANYVNELARSNVPLIFLDSYNGRMDRTSIISDGYYGMYTTVSYLIEMGHRNIYFVGTVGATSSISDRFFGYCRAMAEYGIPVMDDMVLPDRDDEGRIVINIPEKLPTAFACNCDLAAHELIDRLNENGLLVPGDVSVVGFDDFVKRPNKAAHRGVTTYFADIEAMAGACVDEMIQRIENPTRPPALRIITGRLVVKDSVKRVGLRGEPQKMAGMLGV